jgi:tryptophan synthase beta chain
VRTTSGVVVSLSQQPPLLCQSVLAGHLKDFVGRESPLYFADRMSADLGNDVEIYFKREDLNHTGAHKINNALAQVSM